MPLKITSISKNFKAQVVLDNIDLEFQSNSVNVLMGFSGSGKTTLLNILAGLEPCDKGEISPKIQSLGFSFQNDNLFPWLTIFENLEVCGISSNDVTNYCQEFGLSSLLNLYPNQLSGGQRQKINILRSFAKNPEYIFLDEPLAHIESMAKEEFIQFIKKLILKFSTTLIYITHDLDEAFLIGNKIFYLCKKSKKITSVYENKFSVHHQFLVLKKDPQYFAANEFFYNKFKASEV